MTFRRHNPRRHNIKGHIKHGSELGKKSNISRKKRNMEKEMDKEEIDIIQIKSLPWLMFAAKPMQ